jgi:hypothetical protein
LTVAITSANRLASRKHGIEKSLGASDAGFYRKCAECAVSLTGAAFDTQVASGYFGFMVLHGENPARTDFNAPSASGAFFLVKAE